MKKLVAFFLLLALALGCVPAFASEEAPAEQIRYWNNHAVVFGPQIENDWKTFAVVDLSYDGVRTLKLVASGAWHIGNVYVTVEGDNVTVDYRMFTEYGTPAVEVDSAYLSLRTELPTVTDLDAATGFAFGTPISIEQDLNGETILAMYVEMQVDYTSFKNQKYRFWPNVAAHRAIAAEMMYNWNLR